MNRKNKNKGFRRCIASAILAAMVFSLSACTAPDANEQQSAAGSETNVSTEAAVRNEDANQKTETDTQEKALSLWTDSAPLKTQLTEYMKDITDESSADFIPVENRIAVFDLDGTLFCETDPNYFDYTMLLYRVTEDPDYKDKASDFEKEVAAKIQAINDGGKAAEGLEVDHGKAVASAFSGMTQEEFNDYIQKFKKQDMPSYNGMKRGDGFYKPVRTDLSFAE